MKRPLDVYGSLLRKFLDAGRQSRAQQPLHAGSKCSDRTITFDYWQIRARMSHVRPTIRYTVSVSNAR